MAPGDPTDAHPQGQELHQLDTLLHACSAEWCPEPLFTTILACSTYNLQEEAEAAEIQSTHPQPTATEAGSTDTTAAAGARAPQCRKGGVSFYRLADDGGGDSLRLRRLCTWAAPGGVLDAKWCRDRSAVPCLAAPALACAVSTGDLCIITISAGDDGDDGDGEGSGEGGLRVQLVATGAACAEAEDDAPRQRSGSSRGLSDSSSDGGDGGDGGGGVRERIALSVDWAGDAIIVSESTGTLALWRLQATAANGAAAQLTLERRWRAHAHACGGAPAEAWIAFFNPHSARGDGHAPFVVSGGDDGALKGWDARCAPAATPAWSNARAHGAGVTCGEWHPRCPHVFATGCYDEAVRVWDARRAGAGPLSETRVGGGVWRARWRRRPVGIGGGGDSVDAEGAEGEGGGELLAAAMHGGVATLRVRGGGADVALTSRYSAHESMAYGADWCRDAAYAGGGGCAAGAVVATCSFYDHRLCLWRVPPAAHLNEYL